ncbi:MAG: hypothetical protein ACD_69C00003G0002 [uncultured bacterium]|nr:MAG: hypothetical protein ACD_69C00003G0002 [uncultured bacterium]OGT07961.1 MAG: hypothetical protein A2V89_00495 [Gammaproteobacteria bacterium RBG_16_37_9]HBC71966.1 hypothetical protein [Coxiellaceae bacterium]
MLLNPKILDVIACPICKGKLHYDKQGQVLICKFHKLSFPIKNGVPIMQIQQAKSLFINSTNLVEKH